MACACEEFQDRCGNPCAVGTGNTAACESLPSQIQNFSDQFFGPVTKTELDGNVRWVLPCGLDQGLPGNPRSYGEGLACYFLRLFQAGILAKQGPQGPQGPPGTNGSNAYTVTTQAFLQPNISSPTQQIMTVYDPAIMTGSYIFVDKSGYYFVNEAMGNGMLFVTLIQAVTSPLGTIPVGSMLMVCGPPGKSVIGATGAQGPQGPQGPTGATGPAGTSTNFPVAYGLYVGTGADYVLTASFTSVVSVLLANAGTYLLTANFTVLGNASGASVTSRDLAEFKLYNVTTSADIAGSVADTMATFSGYVDTMSISVVVTTSGSNQTVALYGRYTPTAVGNTMSVQMTTAALIWVRLA